jgi:ATP-dependent Clp protease ATP-binding subunit ClpA
VIGDYDREAVGDIPYTPRVKKVFTLASREARAMNHTHIGTEHILLGLLREGGGFAAKVLKDFKVGIEEARRLILMELSDKPWLRPQTASEVEPFQPTKEEQSILKLTPRAQQVMALARKEADRFNHNFVGTEHLLLGLMKLGQGVAVNVLQKLGLDLDILRSEVEKQVGRGPDQKMIGNIPYTPRVKKVLALAAREARALNHTYTGTEHILIGILREGDGLAARVLKNLKVDIEQTRLEIVREISPKSGSPGSGSTNR